MNYFLLKENDGPTSLHLQKTERIERERGKRIQNLTVTKTKENF